MFLQVLLSLVPLLFLSRRDQCFRIVALEQELEVFRRQQGGRRLQLSDADRRFWVMLRRRWPAWNEALVTVKPATVVDWHRKLGRWWQRRHSGPLGRPQCNCYVERLIRTLRQECLRHLIILGERHLRWVLEQYLVYYHQVRPH